MMFTGCGLGWTEFKSHCYFYGQQQVTWLDAKVK